MALNYYRHQLYGLRIQSAFPLPGAPSVSTFDGPPDLTVHWEPETARDAMPWHTTVAAQSANHPDICKLEGGAVGLVWDKELKILISPERDQITVISRPAKLEFAPTVVVGSVLGYLLHLRGILCLHGSVLEKNGRAIAVLGEAGAGKSTIAAALVQRGSLLVSDDMVVVSLTGKQAFVQPGNAGMRLVSTTADQVVGSTANLDRIPYIDKLSWDFSGKTDMPDARYCSRAVPFDAMYILQDHRDEDVSVGPVLAQTETFRHLLAVLYPPGLLRLMTQERLLDLGMLATAVPMHVIKYRKSWDQLSRLLEIMDK